MAILSVFFSIFDHSVTGYLGDNLILSLFWWQVILVTAQCSKSGIIDPVDFIVSEGEDMGILKYLSRGEVDQAKLGELITQHNKILKHAMQCKFNGYDECLADAVQVNWVC